MRNSGTYWGYSLSDTAHSSIWPCYRISVLPGRADFIIFIYLTHFWLLFFLFESDRLIVENCACIKIRKHNFETKKMEKGSKNPSCYSGVITVNQWIQSLTGHLPKAWYPGKCRGGGQLKSADFSVPRVPRTLDPWIWEWMAGWGLWILGFGNGWPERTLSFT